MARLDLEAYKAYVAAQLDRAVSLLQDYALGNFSDTIQVPEEEDVFTALFTALDTVTGSIKGVIREKETLEARLHQMGETLHKSEVRYRTMFEHLPIGIGLATPDGHVLAYNRAIGQMVGYSSAELGQINLRDTYQDPEPRTALLQKLETDGHVRDFEVALKRRDGTPYYANLSVTPIVIEGEKVLVTVAEDITARVQAEKARRRAEARVAHLNVVLRVIRSVNQLIVREKQRDRLAQGICDLLVHTRGFNGAWIILTGATSGSTIAAQAGFSDEAFATWVDDFERGELASCCREAQASAGALLTRDVPTHCATCPLAHVYPADAVLTICLTYQGQQYGFLSVSAPAQSLTDKEEMSLFTETAGDIAFALYIITLEEHRQSTEVQLREDEALLRVIAQNYPRSYLSIIEQDLTIGFTAGQEFTKQNLDPNQFVGLSLERVFGEHTPVVREHYLKTFEGQEQTFELFINNQHQLYRTVPLYAQDGTVPRILAVVENITKRKQAEAALRAYSELLEDMVSDRTAELEKAQERLARQERLAFLGKLAGGISHELRNPLGAIKNAVYFLDIAMENPAPEVKETLEILKSEVLRSERIITSLLDFAHPTSTRRCVVDLNAVVREALAHVTVPENVTVEQQLDVKVPTILADPDQLVQVFGNLMLNAVQAMPEGGQLTITTASAEAGWVQVTVTDTGEGISEENMDNLFEPLFTTKAKGIGLGLVITKNLVDAHHGIIEAHSKVEEGSTFIVKLPFGEREP